MTTAGMEPHSTLWSEPCRVSAAGSELRQATHHARPASASLPSGSITRGAVQERAFRPETACRTIGPWRVGVSLPTIKGMEGLFALLGVGGVFVVGLASVLVAIASMTGGSGDE